MRIESQGSAVDRNQLRIVAESLGGENYPRGSTAANTVLTTQTMVASLLGFRAGDVVTNVYYLAGSTGATVTLARVGVYAIDGTLLANAANDTAKGVTGGLVTFPLSAPYTILADGGYYLAFLTVAATPIGLMRGASLSTMGVAVGSGARTTALQAGQADLPSPATWANGDRVYWFGWS